MNVKVARGAIAALVLAASTASPAQVYIDSRLQMDYIYEFGSPGSFSSGGDRFERTLASGQDYHKWSFADSATGPGFSASVEVAASAHYLVNQSHSSLPWVSLGGELAVGAATSGIGMARMVADFPGVESSARFDILAPTLYRFVGEIMFGPGELGPSQMLAILWDNGVFWEPVWSSASLPGGIGQFDVEGLLAPGQYRAYGRVIGRAHGSERYAASFDADLWIQTVPEPASAFTLASLAAAKIWLTRRPQLPRRRTLRHLRPEQSGRLSEPDLRLPGQ